MVALLIAATLLNAADAQPAPKWLREAEVYNGWYQKWTDEAIEKMRGMPFVVGVPVDKAMIDKAHKAGVRVLTYVTFYQFPPKQKYQNATITDHPDWIIIKPDGSQAPSAFANNPPPDNNPGWLALCPNATTFRKYALEYTRFMMDQGADGVFIDNVFQDNLTCDGPKFGRHKHVYPDKDNMFAFRELLKAVRAEVKRYGADKIASANPGGLSSDWVGACDGQMVESYICTWAADHRWQNEKQILDLARKWSPLCDQGHVIVALSYLGHTKFPIREDAFYCYAWARLSGFLWADWFTGDKSTAVLFKLRLGNPVGPMRAGDGIYTREFEHGLVAATGESNGAAFTISAEEHQRVFDVFEGKHLKAAPSGDYAITLSPGQGRVYLY